ncbi:MAG TPA: MraY family glycosyltransferase [Alphaproteobacteria bacterium]|nr:MraY family glycosyltransferase [Alphaproteobacteria bacterium]
MSGSLSASSLLYALGCTAVAAAITWSMAYFAVLVDVPNARSSHVRPTPRGGGVGILAAFFVGLVAVHIAVDLFDQPGLAAFATAALIMGLAGLVDDVRSMKFTTKLAAQIAASVIAMAGGLVIPTLYIPWIGPLELGAFAYPLTLLWLIGLTNAFNFMDGLDGLAGGVAVIAGGFLCILALLLEEPVVLIVSGLLTAASAGFLIFNLPPARIFMGDVGSQFLGFAFAALSVMLTLRDGTGTLLLLVPVLLFSFLFDTAFTAIRRWRNGENLAAAHRTHLYQLLNRSGLNHRQVAGAQYAMAVVHGVAALWLVRAEPPTRWLLLIALLAAQSAYALVVLRLFQSRNKSVTG